MGCCSQNARRTSWGCCSQNDRWTSECLLFVPRTFVEGPGKGGSSYTYRCAKAGAVLRTFMERTRYTQERKNVDFPADHQISRTCAETGPEHVQQTAAEQPPNINRLARAKSIGNHFERSAEPVRAQSPYKFGNTIFTTLTERSCGARMPPGLFVDGINNHKVYTLVSLYLCHLLYLIHYTGLHNGLATVCSCLENL